MNVIKEMSKAEFMQSMKDKLMAEERRLAKKEAQLQKKKEKEVAEKRKNSPFAQGLPTTGAGPKAPKFLKIRKYGH